MNITHTHQVFSRADWPVRKRLAITIYPQADEKTTPCVKNLIPYQFFWYVVIIEPIFWFLCGTYLISVGENDQGDLATSQLGTCSPLSTYTSVNNCQLLVWQREASNFSVCVLNCKFLGAKMSERGGDVSNWKGIVILRVSPFQSSP